MRFLGISGSLRARSSNLSILKAAAAAAPDGSHLEMYQGLGKLPYFNPDLDTEGAVPPPAVAALRATLAAADAVVICSPEYAHGVPGAMKNALDWLVSDGNLAGKPVAVITAGPGGGAHAHAQLVETLVTMSWNVVAAASPTLAIGRGQFDAQGKVIDAAVLGRLREAMLALAAAVSH